MTVQAVVVAYNSRDLLRACVEPLSRLAWVDVTVVDNASPDDSARAPWRTSLSSSSEPRSQRWVRLRLQSSG